MKKTVLIVTGMIAASTLFAQEQRFFDNFNEYTITPPATETGLPTASPSKWWSRNDDATRQTKVAYDLNNYFGQGTENKVLRMNRTGSATADHNALSVPFTGLQAGMVSFDFYVAEDAITGTTGFRLMLMSDVAANSFDHYSQGYAATGLFITSDSVHGKTAGGAGMLTTKFDYSAGQMNTLAIVFNNSLTAYDYAGGSVASGFMDIYLNGSKVVTWALLQGSNAGVGKDINGLWLSLPNGTFGEIMLDNLLVTTQTIPEASTVSFALLIALAGLCEGLRRRKASRRV